MMKKRLITYEPVIGAEITGWRAFQVKIDGCHVGYLQKHLRGRHIQDFNILWHGTRELIDAGIIPYNGRYMTLRGAKKTISKHVEILDAIGELEKLL